MLPCVTLLLLLKEKKPLLAGKYFFGSTQLLIGYIDFYDAEILSYDSFLTANDRQKSCQTGITELSDQELTHWCLVTFFVFTHRIIGHAF